MNSRYPKMDKYIPVKDIVSNKYSNVHKELFNNALLKCINIMYPDININDFLNTHIITESNFTKYCYPSSAIIKNMEFPFESIEVDLSDYWDTYVFSKKEDVSINIDNASGLPYICKVYKKYCVFFYFDVVIGKS